MKDSVALWEILVPTQFNTGKPIRTRYHRVWDAKVRAIANGLTILRPAKGQWISPTGKLHEERMIPVRILCKKSDMDKIVDMTMVYYDQEAILAYEVSTNVILKHRDSGK
jgi:hypothetical protein